MTKFNDTEDAVGFCKKSLAEHGTATLHLIKEGAVPEDGYIEFALTSCKDTVSVWNNVSCETLYSSGYCEITYDELIRTLSEAGHSKASELLNDHQFVDIVDKNSPLYRKEGDFSFISVGKECIVLIFLSDDWDRLSEYYNQYMKSTRH